MRLLILYFSGTGNTDYVAHYLARRLLVPGLEVAVQPIEREDAEALASFDALAVGFPVFALDAPWLVRDYICQLPPGEGRGTYVFCTKGGMAGPAVRRTLSRLEDRGYVPLGGMSVRMPGSDGLAVVGKGSWLARAALAKDYDHLPAVDRLVQRMRLELAAMIGGAPAEAFRRRIRWRRWEAFRMRIRDAIYRALSRVVQGIFRADDQCVSCGLCARICPVGCIAMLNGRPQFGDDCELCMRCLHACPQEAIQAGRVTEGKFRWKGPKGGFQPEVLRPARSGQGDGC